MPQVKTYVLKKEFPGGYKKGDTVTDRGTGIWTWTKTERTCQFDPLKETAFFEPYAEPKFHVNQEVSLNDLGRRKYRNMRSVSPTAVFKIVKRKSQGSVKSFVYDLFINQKKTIENVHEKYIIVPEKHWFINSKGKVCSDVTVDDFKTKFRKTTGNFYTNLKDAQIRLDAIKEYMKKKF